MQIRVWQRVLLFVPYFPCVISLFFGIWNISFYDYPCYSNIIKAVQLLLTPNTVGNSSYYIILFMEINHFRIYTLLF